MNYQSVPFMLCLFLALLFLLLCIGVFFFIRGILQRYYNQKKGHRTIKVSAVSKHTPRIISPLIKLAIRGSKLRASDRQGYIYKQKAACTNQTNSRKGNTTHVRAGKSVLPHQKYSLKRGKKLVKTTDKLNGG